MKRRLIILQALETWINHLPTETQTGASIATKEDIVRLSEELASRLGEPDESQTAHWLSMLVELYAQAKFGNRTSSHSSLPVRQAGTNPAISAKGGFASGGHSSIVQ